jgi:biotin transport system substrate-specific component
MEVKALDRWRMATYNAYRWRTELSLTHKILLALGMACVIGLAAQIRFPLPWTPVPITGQTFAALLAGVLLGRWWGGISVAAYAGLGVAGLPWFTGWSGGLGHLAGPTGGYIVGFFLAALFVGHFTDKYIRARSFLPMLGILLFADFVLIYVPGLLQLHLWLNLVGGGSASFYHVLTLGFFPFIAGDLIKIFVLTGIASAITHKQAFNGEADSVKRQS